MAVAGTVPLWEPGCRGPVRRLVGGEQTIQAPARSLECGKVRASEPPPGWW